MILNDINHFVGGDLSASSTGDLLTASGTTRGEQRVLRRLLTNPGSYIFHPDYGAGLPRLIGTDADAVKITALVKSQMMAEAVVAPTPPPQVTVTVLPTGSLTIYAQWTDAVSGSPATLNFTISA